MKNAVRKNLISYQTFLNYISKVVESGKIKFEKLGYPSRA